MPAAPPFDRVEVWTATTAEAEPRLADYRGLLPADETARAERFWHAADCHRFVTARAIVRMMLSRYVERPPQVWQLRIESHGRPEIANLPAGAPDLRFNISHTDGLVACAFT